MVFSIMTFYEKNQEIN